ncbi:enoyl-CoA hydratase/isomerase family protein [Aromatoleum toluclasticum]|uniref:enoyl-CoA hydratase/isomerase family protein n=1 Tax=Aromatoleum toluclasticum TaxID=92003 RepID=UPI00036C9276|nr:enoyl-CoA hydratase-related protein [Aromatoleum toluclasticum]
MAYQSIELAVRDGVAHIALNQASSGNPFNEAFCREWLAAADELAGRRDVRAILLTARGKYFSVGGDINLFADSLDQLPQRIREWTGALHMGIARFARLDAPMVAAVHGVAMGGAVALVAGCDVVYAAGRAAFGAAYPTIGYSCDAGASKTLASRMGVARARRFLLCGEMLKAEQALGCGLADFVVDDAELGAIAEGMAQRLAGGPTRAFGEIRRLFGKVTQQSFEAQLEDEAQALAAVAATQDAREGIAAFVEKRRPNFAGR